MPAAPERQARQWRKVLSWPGPEVRPSWSRDLDGRRRRPL